MSAQAVFGLQFLLSTVVFAVVAVILVRPALSKLSRREALLWLTLPHAFRHIGLVFIAPGVVSEELRGSFAASAAYGDLATGILALLAVLALHARWRAAIALVWVTHLVGIADLAKALPQTDVVHHFQAAWYVPVLVVPLLLVTHAMSVARLLRREAAAPEVVGAGRAVEARP